MRLLALAVPLSLLVTATAGADPSVTVAGVVRAGETTRVTATFPGSTGPIRGVAGLGSVGTFKATSAGVFEADFDAPANCGPARVLIAVFEDKPGGQLATGNVNIQDQVKAEVKVHTHEAIFVRAGTVRAGPFHAAPNGEVNLAFAADGESKEAQVETAQGKPLAKVPVKVRRADVALFLRPPRVRPGEAAPAEAVVVAAGEAALKLIGVQATAAAGTFAAAQPLGASAQSFAYTPPAKAASDITVKVADGSGREVVSGAFAIAGQRVAQIIVKLPPKPLGVGELGQLTISLRDQAGHPTDGELTLEADVGTLIAPFQMAPGLYTASFTAPANLNAGLVAHVKARASNSELDSPTQVTVEIPLHGGQPDHVVIAAIPPLKPNEKADLAVQVLDAAGNPTAPTQLDISADKGTISNIRPSPDGHGYLATYTAPDEAAAHVALEAHDGPLRLEGKQELEVAASEQQPPWLLVGPAVGFTSNLGAINTASAVGEVMFRLPYYLSAGLFAGYLPATTTSLTSTSAGGVAGSASFSRIPIHPRVGTLFLQGPFEVHAGIELGPTDISGQLTSEGRTASLSGWHFEYGAYVGGGYHLGPGYLSGELRGTQAKIDVNQDNLTVDGSIGGVDVSIGYLFAI